MSITLGKLIAVEQVIQNITTKEISERSGYSEDYIRKLMRDEIKSPSVPTCAAISKALNLSLLTVLIKTGYIEFPNAEMLTDDEINSFIKKNADFIRKAGLAPSKLNEIEKEAIAYGFLNQLIDLSQNKKY